MADHLAENLIDVEYELQKTYFPDEELWLCAKIFLKHTLVGGYS